MVIVVISGIPKGVKLPKFIGFIKKVIFKENVDVQTYTKPILGTKLKEVSFIMRSNDARRAVRSLNGFNFRYANQLYPLQCWIDKIHSSETFHDDIQDPEMMDMQTDEYELHQGSRQFSRSRSRSPLNSSYELCELDLQIQLVKKQRILIEEETKVLLEKKKLQFLQNCGSDNVEQIKQFDNVLNREDSLEMSELLHSAETTKTVQKEPILMTKRLPNFLRPVRIVTAQIKPKVNGHSKINEENKDIFWKLLRTALKKRFFSVVQGEGFLPCNMIVTKYREVYPKATDKDLINEIFETISTSCWPTKTTIDKINVNSNEEPEKPDTDSSALNKTEESGNLDSFVDLDDFVDMENDLDDWIDDNDEVDSAGQVTSEPVKVTEVDKYAENVTKPTMFSADILASNCELSKNINNDGINSLTSTMSNDTIVQVHQDSKNDESETKSLQNDVEKSTELSTNLNVPLDL